MSRPGRRELLPIAALAVASVAAALVFPGSGSASHGPLVRVAAVAIPLIWSALLLYIPARLAGSWMWRQVHQSAPGARDRFGLVIVLVLAVGLTLWGLEWGTVGDDWAPDELRPNIVRDALSQRFAGGWHDKYPAMHYMVLGLPLAAFEWAGTLSAVAASALDLFVAQYIVVRLVSVLMGLGALIAAYLCAVEMAGARRAVMAPLVLALSPLYVFYGKLANLDVPALCWFGWALLGFIRVRRHGRPRDYVLLGVTAAAAVATKDQSYASLAFLVPAVLWFTITRQPDGPWWRRSVMALGDRRLLAGLAATVLASLVFHNVVFNPRGFAEHLSVLAAFNDIAIVPRTAAGAWEMTWRTVDLWRMSMGLPLFGLAVWGVLRAWSRPDRRWWLWLLLVPLSFHVTFTCVTFFVCDRYLFTGLFVLALFAGATLGDMLNATRHRGLALGVAGAALCLSLPYAASVNVMMNLDARKAARDWVQRQAPDGSVVGLVGRYVPYFPPPLRAVAIESSADAAAARPAFIVVNARFAARFQRMRSPAGRELMRDLRAGSLGYARCMDYRAPLPFWAWLQYEPSFRRGGESWWTNLDKVNPEMLVYCRE
jgi:hypothetical protein